MNKITCLIVDDEPLALDLLERYVTKTPFLELVHKCESAIEALEFVNKQQVDLLFLDIQMPELTGLELARLLPKETKVVFTTAFNDYAIDGFKVNAIDYLLKPFNYEEFLRASVKAKEWFELSNSTAKAKKDVAETRSYIFVKSEYKQLKIKLDDIIYFEGLKDYVKIWLKSQSKPILTIMSLKAIAEDLATTSFMRIHRSFIISLDQIQSVERSQVVMSNGERITIADQYKEQFQNFISDKSIS